MTAFTALFLRDLRLVLRRPGDIVVVLAFFVVATTLFPLGIGPEQNLLARIAGGVLWAAALFAALLSLERLFASDYVDGALDLLLLAPGALELARRMRAGGVAVRPFDALPVVGDALRITVTVTGPHGTSVSLDGYRTRHAPNAAM